MMAALVVVLVLGGAIAGIRGIRRVAWSLRNADDGAASLTLVRGIRGLVFGVGAWAVAGGMLLGATWLIVFGVVFLAEELYETGVLAVILRCGPTDRARGAL
jgi:hypothetical protein